MFGVNIQQMRYVKALAERGSFVAAAARCSVAQPTLSNSIAQLEAELGHRIFNRMTRTVRLTPFGEALLPAVTEVLAGVDRIKRLAGRHSDESGTVVQVGFSPVIGVRKAALLFDAAISQKGVRAVYNEDHVDGLLRRLIGCQLDFAVAPVDAGSSDLDGCVCALLERDQLFYLPKVQGCSDLPASCGVEIMDIAYEEFVFPLNDGGLTRAAKQLFRKNNVILKRYPGTAASFAVIHEWAELGLAASILPASALNQTAPAPPRIPLLCNGLPLTIDYYVFGKPNTISTALFSEIWKLLKVENRHRNNQKDDSSDGCINS